MGRAQHLLERIQQGTAMIKVPQEKVTELLLSLESEFGIRIKYAAEVGSRAWGYASETSDLDIHLVYVQLPWMKKIQDRNDTIRVFRDITFTVDGTEHKLHLDILGFEFRKAIQKLTASDLTYHEMLDSSRLLGCDSDAMDDLQEVAHHYRNDNTLFQVCLDLSKRNLYIGGINRKGDAVTSKSLILGLRFALMAYTLSTPGTLECRLDNLIAMNSIRLPWVKGTLDWLTANRDMTADHLLSDPRSMQIIQLYHKVVELPHPEGKRDHDMTFANDHYRRTVQETLATYHVTNASDLIAGVF